MTHPIALIRHGSACLLACVLVTLLAGANPPAYAAPQSAPTFIVNRTFDAAASPPLDSGPCETAPGDGICTLRAAVMKANHFPGGGATIIIPALSGGQEYRLTRPASNADDETGGDLNIKSDMLIEGNGPGDTIIDASGITPTTRVLSIESPNVSIGAVTIQGGHATGADYGGGIFVHAGGGLFLFNSSVTSNTATVNGGGIFVDSGSLTMTLGLVSNNKSGSNGGGIDIMGGSGLLGFVTVSNNTSFFGGGVENISTNRADMDASTISGNSAFEGGGIYNKGLFNIDQSTITNNFADVSGGGMLNDNPGSCGYCVLEVFQSTIVGNLANQAVSGGTGGGIFNLGTAQTIVQNTLLDGNVRSTAGPDVFDDCSGMIISQSLNLISTTAGCSVVAGSNDLKDVPGLTGPLQNNGGLTFTNALLPGSPAIDAIPVGVNGCGTSFTTDQRDLPRPAFGGHSFRCDIGAFEVQQMVDLPLVLR